MKCTSGIIGSAVVGFLIGLYLGTLLFYPMNKGAYMKCRYYDQTIERCVTELGWEKK